MSKDKDNVIDFEDFQERKELREKIERLDRLGKEIYNNPMDPERKGLKNFLDFLKRLDEKYDKEK